MHPTLVKIGNFEIPSFGAMMVLAFLAGLWLANRRAPRFGITSQQISDCAFWALLSGILGARLVYIGLNLNHFLSHPQELLAWRFQGLTSFGGLIVGGLAVVIYSRKHGIPLLKILDLLAPAFLLGHVVGRFGCLLNGCCYGNVCPPDLPWGIHIKNYEGVEALHHPAQVYDSMMNLAALGLVLLFERRPHMRGQIFGVFLILHGITRFIYEFWRAGTEAQVRAGDATGEYLRGLPITEAQGMALVLIVAGAAVFLLCGKRAVPATDAAATA